MVSRRPWSVSTSRVSPVGVPVSSSTGASTAAISRLNRPSSTATRAFCWEASPNASICSRVKPRLRAIRSAASNWLGMSIDQLAGRGSPVPGGDVGAERDPAHRLDAAGDAGVDGAGGDERGDEVGGVLGRAALGVDGGGPGALGEPRVQPGPADHVVGLLAGLGDAAADHLVDEVRVDAGPVEDGLLGRAEQLAGVQAGQPAAPAAERGADCLDDDRVAHRDSSRRCAAHRYILHQSRTRSRFVGKR